MELTSVFILTFAGLILNVCYIWFTNKTDLYVDFAFNISDKFVWNMQNFVWNVFELNLSKICFA